MTIEARIPLNELKVYCRSHKNWYNVNSAMQQTYKYKKNTARSTFIWLVAMLALLFLTIVCVVIYSSAPEATAENEISPIYALAAIFGFIFGISLISSLFYIQEDTRAKVFSKRIRFRPVYFTKLFIRDLREFKKFKKLYNTEASAFRLIVSWRDDEANEKISYVAAMICIDDIKYIIAYDTKYKDYREYVDLMKTPWLANEIYGILTSGRATNMQGALAVIDTRRYREEQARKQDELNATLREQANSAIAENKAGEDAYRAEEAFWKEAQKHFYN